MKNLYVLEKMNNPSTAKAVPLPLHKGGRRVLRTVVHIGFRAGVVASAILIVGVIAGAEFGPLMLGRRILMVAMLLVMLGASALGMKLTDDVTLPLDGGEGDE